MQSSAFGAQYTSNNITKNYWGFLVLTTFSSCIRKSDHTFKWLALPIESHSNPNAFVWQNFASTFHLFLLEPGPPTAAWTKAGNRSLQVFWTPPVGSTCVHHYQVTVSRDKITKSTTEHEITIDELSSCRVYEIRIVPMHIHGESPPAIIQSNRTFPAVMDFSVSQNPTSTSHSISLIWRVYTNEDNNCEDTKLVTRCNYTQVCTKRLE